jgi:hypothetical protein
MGHIPFNMVERVHRLADYSEQADGRKAESHHG